MYWLAVSMILHARGARHQLADMPITLMVFLCVQAEFESRCEMYEAQVTKMQRSMERSDTDKAKVEEQLARAIALTHSGDKQVRHNSCQFKTQTCNFKTLRCLAI